MRYYATLDGVQRTIDIDSLGGSRFRLSIDGGEPREVDAEKVEGSVIHLLVDHASWDVDIEERGEKLGLLVGDRRFELELADERRLRLRAAQGKFSVEGPVVVESPMPGKVVKVLVAPGEEVQEGQGLVIVEAMKMENELEAPKAGKIGAVHVSEGQTVEGGQALVALE